MKKHENAVIIIGLMAVIGLTAVASGFAYAYARSQHTQGKCPCNTVIINMANKREVSHYLAASYIEREIRLGYSNEDLVFVEACRKWHAEREL